MLHWNNLWLTTQLQQPLELITWFGQVLDIFLFTLARSINHGTI